MAPLLEHTDAEKGHILRGLRATYMYVNGSVGDQEDLLVWLGLYCTMNGHLVAS